MKQEGIDVKKLTMVVDALTMSRIFSGEPTFFSEAYHKKMAAIRSVDNGTLPLDTFHALVSERIKEELLTDIIKEKEWVQPDLEEELLDLYLNKYVYEEAVNGLVER